MPLPGVWPAYLACGLLRQKRDGNKTAGGCFDCIEYLWLLVNGAVTSSDILKSREAGADQSKRIEEHAPETAANLRALVQNFQMGRIRDLLKEAEIKHDS